MPMQSPELSTRLAQAGQPRRNASEPLLVGIDLGTTTCKAVVVSAGGAELAHNTVPTPWRAVPSGAETDPRVLVDAALGAAERALARTPDGPVLAVGVTSMAETCALLGADGEPVAPAIAWHDLRGQDEAAALATGGTRRSPGPGARPGCCRRWLPPVRRQAGPAGAAVGWTARCSPWRATTISAPRSGPALPNPGSCSTPAARPKRWSARCHRRSRRTGCELLSPVT